MRSAPLAFASRHPRLGAALGAMAISQSSPLAKLSGASPAVVTLFRGAVALPFLALLARREGHAPARRDRALAILAGGLFALDLQCFHISIPLLGVALATVVPNAQVFIVGLFAALAGERTPGRAIVAIPFALIGLLMLARVVDPFGGGVISTAVVSAGSDPALGVLWGIGAAAFYGLYLIITRRISTSATGSSAVGPFTMLRDSALGTIAVSLLLALLSGSLLPPQVWPGVGWLVLLALMSQVLGYPLINASIPHLPSVVGSVLLFVQPLMTLVAGVIIFGEIPTPGQLVGALILFGGVLVAARK
ncbi:MAG: DMT family transporter [Chloroflexi bacterium]|jgi:drug/metabolite transporter (DMT)-like permease|nr:DMT family transporter [Chloroflexota bacterium]